MKKIKTCSELLNESSNIVTKDWNRMLDLVLSGNDGDNVAKSIKDKDKAIARFVAGLKLSNSPLIYSDTLRGYTRDFNSFGDRALQLGATKEEIQKVYDETEVPPEFLEKIKNLNGKKLSNRFVGSISKTILDMGLDINYLPHNGYAITLIGKDAMSRNGRKWTIGYKAVISNGNQNFNFNVDAITDEGDGPTFYVIDPSSDKIFSSVYYQRLGKNAFISHIKDILKNII